MTTHPTHHYNASPTNLMIQMPRRREPNTPAQPQPLQEMEIGEPTMTPPPRSPHLTQKSAIRVCSLNVNHSNAAAHAAMHHITTQKDLPYDIILIQEPWWGEVNSTFTTVSLVGWQLTLPKLIIPQNEQPRMVAYHRIGMGINLILRTDIAQDPDYMIMNIKREEALC